MTHSWQQFFGVSTGRKLCALRQACPLYLSEMAPAHLRGSINICFQLATAIGILVANCLNYGEPGWLQMPAKIVML